MRAEKARGLILALSLMALAAAHLIEQALPALVLMAVCVLLALFVLCCNLDRLTDLSSDNPKMKTLRFITVFDGAVIVIAVVFVALVQSGLLHSTQRTEEYFLTGLLSVIMLVLSNLCPKLPFNRHTGLRLPWTVRDEQTWIVAHRIIGYISLPLTILFLAATPLVENYKALFLTVFIAWIGIPSVLSGVFFYRGFRR